MFSRLAGRFHIAALIAVITSLFAQVDIATKAIARTLEEASIAGIPTRIAAVIAVGTVGAGVGFWVPEAWSITAMSALALGVVESPVGRGGHHDAPLSNIAIAAFQGSEDYVGPRLFPVVGVGKQSDRYYIIDPDSWLRVPDTRRAPKTAPNRIEFKVSSDAYFADNYALAGENAKEDLSNVDAALQLRESTTLVVTQGLLRDLEVRIANKVTSVSNVGSGVALTGASKWSDFVSSDPLADVTTGHAFIRQKTGLVANTAVIDEDTFQIVRRHPKLLDLYKYTRGGQLSDAEIAAVFQVQNLMRARGIKNMALEGATASMVNIWGNSVVLAHVVPGVSLKTATFGLCMQWTPEGLPAPFMVERYDHPDPGKKVEVIQAGYYQDEKIVARDLCYTIKDTL